MKVPYPIDPYYRTNTVRPLGYHEAGHYVVARVLGFKTGSLKLKMLDMHGSHNGGSVLEPFSPLYNIDDVITYLEARIQVLFAGSLAQSLSNGKVDEKIAVKILEEGGGQNDFAKARELMHIIKNTRYPTTTDPVELQRGLDNINNNLWGRAIALVETDHELICGLGNRLASELKVIGQEFELIETELESSRAIKERFSK